LRLLLLFFLLFLLHAGTNQSLPPQDQPMRLDRVSATDFINDPLPPGALLFYQRPHRH
jgi:hypothetical protein